MKVTPNLEKTSPGDWHPAEVVAALRMKGWSFRQLSIINGYHTNSLTGVLRRTWPKGEAIVAEAIGVEPQRIWPSRYGPDGKPNRCGNRVLRPANAKPSRLTAGRNPQKRRVA